MSRVGKKPISIPAKVDVSLKDRLVTVKGSKGTLSRTIHADVDLQVDGNVIQVVIQNEDRKSRALQGLTRSLVNNMVTGVSSGFERVLEINGIGYRAEVKGQTLVLNLGYSNPVNFDLPKGIAAAVDRNTIIKLTGIDKEQLGQTAASIRKLRPPEPYKGKGIKYAEERIIRKAGKTGTK
ncbi:MAG: 50S ribosomal protein L6 [Desulfobacterales bacterium]|nr:50S ribosomal protein L6 [Desulfobacterales bacterium]MDJ0875156.1 50S ribosomal protein L6 [Desulfobacterales bacterium]